MIERPSFIVVAGPNGAGKSTYTRTALRGAKLAVLDPDAVASQLNPKAPEQAAIAAGRTVIRERNALLKAGTSFIVETTLAGATTLGHIEAARAAGFDVHLIYVCAEPVEVCIRRVTQRASRGGHSVPEPDIRRRYARSLVNLPIVVRQAESARLFDNSGVGSGTLVAEFAKSELIYRAAATPKWLAQSLGVLLPAPEE